MNTRVHTLTYTLTHSLTHTHSRTHACTHIHSHTHTHVHTRTHTHTCAHTLSHTHSHTHTLLCLPPHPCSVLSHVLELSPGSHTAANPPVSRGQKNVLGLRAEAQRTFGCFSGSIREVSHALSYAAPEHLWFGWFVTSGNRKLRPGLTTAAASPHLLVQPHIPGLCLDYFQSVLRRAWALVQPAGYGRGQDVSVP